MERHEAILNLSANISHIMAENGMTVRALAKAVKAPPSTIQTLVKGDYEPRISLVARVAKSFGMGIDELLLKPAEFRKLFRHQAIAS